MSFRDIRGQDRAVEFLKNSAANGSVSHAYIFLGPPGVGKVTAALNFAKFLNCAAPVSGEPCEKCISCAKINNSNHPDIVVIRPEIEKGKKTASIKIEKIYDLVKSASLKPHEAAVKVFIIDGAQTMTKEAASAFLKTLEEPPPNMVIILTAENLKALFPTVISRSQVVRFLPLKPAEVKDILVKNHSVDSARADILSRLASGRIGEAIKYKDGDFFDKRSMVMNDIAKNGLHEMDFKDMSRDEIKMYLDIMLTWYRDLLAAKAGAGDKLMINADKAVRIAEESKALSLERIEGILRQIMETYVALDQNANPALAMSVLGLKITEDDICTK